MGKLLTVLGVDESAQNALGKNVLQAEQIITGMQGIYQASPESPKKEALARAISEATRVMLAEIRGEAPPAPEMEEEPTPSATKSVYLTVSEMYRELVHLKATKQELRITAGGSGTTYADLSTFLADVKIVGEGANQNIEIEDTGGGKYYLNRWIDDNEQAYEKITLDDDADLVSYRAYEIKDTEFETPKAEIIPLLEMLNIIQARKGHQMEFFGTLSKFDKNGIEEFKPFIGKADIVAKDQDTYIELTDRKGKVFKLTPFEHEGKSVFTSSYDNGAYVTYNAMTISEIKSEEPEATEIPEDEDYKNWSQPQLVKKKEEIVETFDILDEDDPEYEELQIALDEINLYIE